MKAPSQATLSPKGARVGGSSSYCPPAHYPPADLPTAHLPICPSAYLPICRPPYLGQRAYTSHAVAPNVTHEA